MEAEYRIIDEPSDSTSNIYNLVFLLFVVHYLMI